MNATNNSSEREEQNIFDRIHNLASRIRKLAKAKPIKADQPWAKAQPPDEHIFKGED